MKAKFGKNDIHCPHCPEHCSSGLGLRYPRTGGSLLCIWFWRDNKICEVSSYPSTVKRWHATSISEQSLASLSRLRTLRASVRSSRMTSAIPYARGEVLGSKWLKYSVVRYQSTGFCMSRKNFQSIFYSNIPILRSATSIWSSDTVSC